MSKKLAKLEAKIEKLKTKAKKEAKKKAQKDALRRLEELREHIPGDFYEAIGLPDFFRVCNFRDDKKPLTWEEQVRLVEGARAVASDLHSCLG